MNRTQVQVDAVNYCHSPVLYQSQLVAAQWRCNVNRTVELVLHVDADNNIIEQQVIVADRDLPDLVLNQWR
jgi:hypothetical protein